MANVADETIVAALMTTRTIREAADRVGLTPRAVSDRMHRVEFRRLYRTAKPDTLRTASQAVNAKLCDAVEAVAAIMADPDVNASVRL